VEKSGALNRRMGHPQVPGSILAETPENLIPYGIGLIGPQAKVVKYCFQ